MTVLPINKALILGHRLQDLLIPPILLDVLLLVDLAELVLTEAVLAPVAALAAAKLLVILSECLQEHFLVESLREIIMARCTHPSKSWSITSMAGWCRVQSGMVTIILNRCKSMAIES